jgi:hypothetical protein
VKSGGGGGGFLQSLWLVRGRGGVGFTLALRISSLPACLLGSRASVSLLSLPRGELTSALLAGPLWSAVRSFFGRSSGFSPRCAIPFLCKSFLLLLGLGR